MPPIKEFIFENSDKNITIKINAFYFIDAMEILVMTTKHPTNFKCINV